MRLEGKPVSDEIDVRTKEARDKLDRFPVLNIVRVGENEDDVAYENAIVRKAKLMDVDVTKRNVLETGNVAERTQDAIEDLWYGGQALMVMCPKDIREEVTVPKRNDVEGLNPNSDFYACTPEAIIRILDHYKVPIEGKNVVIVNRSKVVGRPLADMLLDRDATVTVCHSKTENLYWHINNANILITATGNPEIFHSDTRLYLAPTVIDVAGDVDFDNVIVENYATMMDVGRVATSLLLENVVELTAGKN